MNTKIVIEVKGGTVAAVHSTSPIEIVIIDYDNIDNGSPAWNGNVLNEDRTFKSGEAHLLFTNMNDQVEYELHHDIKRIHF